MKSSEEMRHEIIDDIKSGALAVINKALHDTIQISQTFENWPAEEKAKYFLILDVEAEIIRRVNRTLNRKRKKK